MDLQQIDTYEESLSDAMLDELYSEAVQDTQDLDWVESLAMEVSHEEV